MTVVRIQILLAAWLAGGILTYGIYLAYFEPIRRSIRRSESSELLVAITAWPLFWPYAIWQRFLAPSRRRRRKAVRALYASVENKADRASQR